MKSSWLIILLIIVVGSTINLGSTIKFGTPSIELVGNEEFAGKNGDVFIYSIKLRSNENLINFKVVPNIMGKNQDCLYHQFGTGDHEIRQNHHRGESIHPSSS